MSNSQSKQGKRNGIKYNFCVWQVRKSGTLLCSVTENKVDAVNPPRKTTIWQSKPRTVNIERFLFLERDRKSPMFHWNLLNSGKIWKRNH